MNKVIYWIPFLGILKFGRNCIKKNIVPDDNKYMWFELYHLATSVFFVLWVMFKIGLIK